MGTSALTPILNVIAAVANLLGQKGQPNLRHHRPHHVRKQGDESEHENRDHLSICARTSPKATGISSRTFVDTTPALDKVL